MNRKTAEEAARTRQIKNNWVGFREWHDGGDFRVIYRLAAESEQAQIVFARTTTHTDQFEG